MTDEPQLKGMPERDPLEVLTPEMLSRIRDEGCARSDEEWNSLLHAVSELRAARETIAEQERLEKAHRFTMSEQERQLKGLKWCDAQDHGGPDSGPYSPEEVERFRRHINSNLVTRFLATISSLSAEVERLKGEVGERAREIERLKDRQHALSSRLAALREKGIVEKGSFMVEMPGAGYAKPMGSYLIVCGVAIHLDNVTHVDELIALLSSAFLERLEGRG